MIKNAMKATLLCGGVTMILYMLCVLPFMVCEKRAEAVPIDSYEITPPRAMLFNGSASADTSIFTPANAGVDTVYSDSVYVGLSQYFSAYIRAQSANGTPNIKFFIMQAPHKDSTKVDPEGRTHFIQVEDENPHLLSIEPVVADWLWYRMEGQTGNATDTTVYLLHTEQPGRLRK